MLKEQVNRLFSSGLSPSFRDRGGFPFSRDFAMPTVPCGAKDCVANDGNGKCVMPSSIKINQKRKCKGYCKSTNEGKGGGS